VLLHNAANTPEIILLLANLETAYQQSARPSINSDTHNETTPGNAEEVYFRGIFSAVPAIAGPWRFDFWMLTARAGGAAVRKSGRENNGA
jgi:hypothetical protein